MPESGRVPPGVDPTTPSPARIYDYVLGGTHNFPADRDAAERIRAEGRRAPPSVASAPVIGAGERKLVGVGQLPVEDAPGVSEAAHEAASGRVVYLTEHGQRLAAIVPAEYAAALEAMTPEQAAELLEDLADGADAREALAEMAAGGQPIAAEEVWAELGIDPMKRRP